MVKRYWIGRAGILIGVLALTLSCVVAPLHPQGGDAPSPSAIVEPTATPTAAPTAGWTELPTQESLSTVEPFQVTVDQVEIQAETVSVTVTIISSGPSAVLFDPPKLDGQPATPASLEQAHLDELDLVTARQAVVHLAFPRPEGQGPWTLVFNPAHEADSYVAPRVAVEVEGS